MKKAKRIWWAGLALGSGGTLLFCEMFAIGRTMPEPAWVWGVASTILAMVSVWHLVACYRAEPHTGPWQFSLKDLMTVPLLAGVFFAVFKAVLGDNFVTIGIPYAVFLGVMLPFGFIAATRKEIAGLPLRCLYAIGFSFRLAGLLIVVGLVTLWPFGAAIDHRSIERELLDFLDAVIHQDKHVPFLMLVRIGGVLLVAGIAACFVAKSIQAAVTGKAPKRSAG
ncbi:MAG: hypothetical protein ABSE73_32330 [Planctomycetota bacterium]